MSVDSEKFDLEEEDEADELASEKRLGRHRRLDLIDFVGILLVIGSALFSWFTSGFSYAHASKAAFWAFLAYIALRVEHDASNVYESYKALQFRTKLINQKLTKIEETLDRRLDELGRKFDSGIESIDES